MGDIPHRAKGLKKRQYVCAFGEEAMKPTPKGIVAIHIYRMGAEK